MAGTRCIGAFLYLDSFVRCLAYTLVLTKTQDKQTYFLIGSSFFTFLLLTCVRMRFSRLAVSCLDQSTHQPDGRRWKVYYLMRPYPEPRLFCSSVHNNWIMLRLIASRWILSMSRSWSLIRFGSPNTSTCWMTCDLYTAMIIYLHPKFYMSSS